VEKVFGGLLAVGGKGVGWDRVEGGFGGGDLKEVAADEAGVCGVGRQRLATTEVEVDLIVAEVFSSEAEDGEVHGEVSSGQ